MHALLPHQQQALTYADGRHGVSIFMEMRLGKTLVAILWGQSLPAQSRLVVAPLSVLQTWVEALEEEGLSSCVIRGSRPARLKAAESPADWHLVSYDGLRATPELASRRWDLVILDESTRIKNPQAQITKIINGGTVRAGGRRTTYAGLRRVSKYRAILTGLPAPESDMDYFEQMRFVYGSFLGYSNFWEFRQGLFLPAPEGYGWVPKHGTQQKVEAAVQASSFVLSRREAGIGSAKVYERRYAYLPEKVAQQYKELEETWEFGGLETKWEIVANTWLARIAGGGNPGGQGWLHDSKYNLLLELLTGELRREPVLVWFRFTQELNRAVQGLVEEGVEAAKIDGSTPPAERAELQRRFQAGQLRVLCMQSRTSRYGLDFSRASTAIYYSNEYSWETRSQTEDRLVHPQKNDPLLYIDLVTQETVDLDALRILRRKRIRGDRFMSLLRQEFNRRRGKSDD